MYASDHTHVMLAGRRLWKQAESGTGHENCISTALIASDQAYPEVAADPEGDGRFGNDRGQDSAEAEKA